MQVVQKKCLGCGEVKPLSDFHKARVGRFGRASRCKTCLSRWHQVNHLRRVAADPNHRERMAEKSRAWYWSLGPEEKQAFMQRVKDRNQRLPNAALTKNLCRALRRRPTDNPVTINELVEIWVNQEGRCALSGIEMKWSKGAYGPASMSIDRIDCEKGYTKDNVRLVCYAVNCFRGRWDDAVVVEMARAIVNKADQPNFAPFTFVA